MKTEKCIMPANYRYSTERFIGAHRHEVFFGTGNRQLSIEDGLIVFLKPEYHNTSIKGVHYDKDFDLYLKRIGQKAWQEYYDKTEEEFIQRYGRSYLNVSSDINNR